MFAAAVSQTHCNYYSFHRSTIATTLILDYKHIYSGAEEEKALSHSLAAVVRGGQVCHQLLSALQSSMRALLHRSTIVLPSTSLANLYNTNNADDNNNNNTNTNNTTNNNNNNESNDDGDQWCLRRQLPMTLLCCVVWLHLERTSCASRFKEPVKFTLVSMVLLLSCLLF
jgi:hypothetical protein